MTYFDQLDPLIKWPLVLLSGSDLVIVDDQHELRRETEPDYLSDLDAFDAAGRALDLYRSVDGVRASIRTNLDSGPNDLAESLRRILRAWNQPVEPLASLDELIVAARRISGQ